MRKKFGQEDSPIRTYLVSARGGREMGSRAIITLREWGLAIDEAFFMDGAPKGPILSEIQPHIFFDDALHNIQNAQDLGVPSALVPCDCKNWEDTRSTWNEWHLGKSSARGDKHIVHALKTKGSKLLCGDAECVAVI